MTGKPLLDPIDCMNHAWPSTQPACTRCRDACPADAIHMHGHLPSIDDACTVCTACVTACPTTAIRDERLDAGALVRRARANVMQGKQILRAACAFAADADADLQLPCHAAWNPLLLSCVAGEGVHVLELGGIDRCADCPVRHGERMLAQTEQDYAEFSKAMAVRLVIKRGISKAPEPESQREPEPERRAFFRKLVPSLAQGAAMAAAQISEAMRGDESGLQAHGGEDHAPPLLSLFVKALPRLRPNFTPVPRLPSVPLGAIQADARCNACGQCTAQCPTQALALKPFGANRVLEFRPDACIGCDHCVAICPEQAITSLPSISLPAVAAQRSRPLVMVGAGRPNPEAAVS